VHVVDKATKLETLFDRIQLIDTRFEVLKRDAEIALLKGEIDAADACAAWPSCAIARPSCAAPTPAASSWRRGHRAVQAHRRAPLAAPTAASSRCFLSADEVENLSIRRGTLNRAEREIINHHIVMTIRMLEALPWPAHLERVPEYAGGHHERMDGKGYPRGLTREQMSVPARVMGIADVFEALTAKRPALQARQDAVGVPDHPRPHEARHHIDPDLFDVFLRERVYLDYARAS
jgi:hypothetical protein